MDDTDMLDRRSADVAEPHGFWYYSGVATVWVFFLAVFALAFIPLMAWRAWVAITLWKWFITPVWPDLWPHPSVYVAGGIMFIISAFVPHAPLPKKTNKYSWVTPFLFPALLLACGWLWKWWFT